MASRCLVPRGLRYGDLLSMVEMGCFSVSETPAVGFAGPALCGVFFPFRVEPAKAKEF